MSENSNISKSIFLAFEGGGAKGFAHIAALKSVEKTGVPIEGVAGTSAGAIIASLVAAGWKSDELVRYQTQEIETHSEILNILDLKKVTDVFGTWN